MGACRSKDHAHADGRDGGLGAYLLKKSSVQSKMTTHNQAAKNVKVNDKEKTVGLIVPPPIHGTLHTPLSSVNLNDSNSSIGGNTANAPRRSPREKEQYSYRWFIRELVVDLLKRLCAFDEMVKDQPNFYESNILCVDYLEQFLRELCDVSDYEPPLMQHDGASLQSAQAKNAKKRGRLLQFLQDVSQAPISEEEDMALILDRLRCALELTRKELQRTLSLFRMAGAKELEDFLAWYLELFDLFDDLHSNDPKQLYNNIDSITNAH